MRKLQRLALVLGAFSLLPLTAGAAHAAEDGGGGGGSHAVYKLIVSPGEKIDPAVARRATLTCDPPGGSHPKPYEACRLIRQHGTIATVDESEGKFCTMQYEPVTVVALKNGRVQYGPKTFGNPCQLISEKEAIFDF
ncbi:SSI family serine proteinase inhibitor [Longimycelium tulufanense]|uniref:SSI family serine proteinase inhibitor n=1 Tax=Longimycelium tulufanense TaxID=907463 RepID=UPI00166A689F|nr:SSI family serine proteinase inhibitor [Longimycelium tulufanense]